MRRREIVTVANGRVTVAVFKARYALTVVARITNEQRLAAGALSTYGVVLTAEAHVQLLGTGTFGMTVTLALDAAVGSDESKVTAAHVRFQTIAVQATLFEFKQQHQNMKSTPVFFVRTNN